MAQIIKFPQPDENRAATYTNFKGQVYRLCQGKTKTGKAKYYFSTKKGGNLAQSIPDGFEVYENPNGLVFCRKIPPKIITDAEVEIVKSGMIKFSNVKNHKIDVKKNEILVYIANSDEVDRVVAILSNLDSEDRTDKIINNVIHYTAEMKFTLADRKLRDFIVQRFNYRGKIDDWMSITDGCGSLHELVEKYVVHLGQDSFFTLY